MSFTKLPHAEEGDSAAECAKKLVDAGADIVGVNCLRSPEAMLPLVREMREAVSGYVAAQPVAYRVPADSPDFTSLPQFPYELDTLQLTRKDFADYTREALDLGVNYIGRVAARWPSTCGRWRRSWAGCPPRNASGSLRPASRCRDSSTTSTPRKPPG